MCSFHLELKDHKETYSNYNNKHEQEVLEYSFHSNSGTDFKSNRLEKRGQKYLCFDSNSVARKLGEKQGRRQILRNQKDSYKNRQPGTNGIREYCGQYGLLEGKRR